MNTQTHESVADEVSKQDAVLSMKGTLQTLIVKTDPTESPAVDS